jgi:hypothetical protein
MVSPEVPRNVAGGAKRRPRCRRMSQYNATKDSIKVGVPYEPRPGYLLLPAFARALAVPGV